MLVGKEQIFSSNIFSITSELLLVEEELLMQPGCQLLYKQKCEILERLVDAVRSERVTSEARLRQFRGECTSCERCRKDVLNL